MTAERIDAEITAFEDVRDEIEAFCAAHALPPKLAFSVNLVLEELIVNIFEHGYAGGGGVVRLELARKGDAITGIIVDHGNAYDPRAAAPPDLAADIEDRSVGGLGVHLIRSMVDEFHYQRTGGKNVTRFRIRLAPDGQAEG